MINNDVSAEVIADNARNSISSYCFNECKSYCCRKGFLVLSLSQVKLLTNGKEDGLKKISEDSYSLDLSSNGGCPSLKEDKCVIHKNNDRPSACKEFPLFIWEDGSVKVSQRCPAVKDGLLYPYLAELKSKGYIIRY